MCSRYRVAAGMVTYKRDINDLQLPAESFLNSQVCICFYVIDSNLESEYSEVIGSGLNAKVGTNIVPWFVGTSA